MKQKTKPQPFDLDIEKELVKGYIGKGRIAKGLKHL